jgi:hypothetical protein
LKGGIYVGFFGKIFGRKKAHINTSIDPFLRRILKEPSYCQIRILQIPEFYDALVNKLMKEGFSTSKIVNLVNANLKGVCPECGSWYSSDGLAICGITQSSPLLESKKLFRVHSQAGSGAIERILNGDCINPRCSCKDLVICWQVEEEHVGVTYADAARGLGLSKVEDPYDVW